MLTAEQAAAKWQANLAAAGPAYIAGVNAVTTAPTQLAAAQQDKWARNVQLAAQTGRFANKLNAVTLQQWQDAARSKGASRLTSGAALAKPKMAQFLSAFLPVMQQVKAQVATMPKNGIEDSLARVRAQIMAAKQFAGRPLS
jgi:hypothetical protein